MITIHLNFGISSVIQTIVFQPSVLIVVHHCELGTDLHAENDHDDIPLYKYYTYYPCGVIMTEHLLLTTPPSLIT